MLRHMTRASPLEIPDRDTAILKQIGIKILGFIPKWGPIASVLVELLEAKSKAVQETEFARAVNDLLDRMDKLELANEVQQPKHALAQCAPRECALLLALGLGLTDDASMIAFFTARESKFGTCSSGVIDLSKVHALSGLSESAFIRGLDELEQFE